VKTIKQSLGNIGIYHLLIVYSVICLNHYYLILAPSRYLKNSILTTIYDYTVHIHMLIG